MVWCTSLRNKDFEKRAQSSKKGSSFIVGDALPKNLEVSKKGFTLGKVLLFIFF